MSNKELKDLTVVELNEKLKSLKESLFSLRFQNAVNQLENPLRIQMVRKDIARVKTELRSRELRQQDDK